MTENSNGDKSAGPLNRRKRGADSYREGYSFEEKVAELYRLLHYDVEHGRIFGGRQVDLFITTSFGDMKLQRAIECKAGAVLVEHIDSKAKHLAFTRCGELNLNGMVDTQIAMLETELLAGDTVRC